MRYIFNESVSTPVFTFVLDDPTQLNYVSLFDIEYNNFCTGPIVSVCVCV